MIMLYHNLIICRVTLLLVLLCSIVHANGQETAQCIYDQAGNRLTREIYYPDRNSLRGDSITRNSLILNNQQLGGHIVHVVYVQKESKLIVEILGISADDVCDISIFNLTGISVLRQKIDSTPSTFYLYDLSNGIYIVSLELNGERRCWKIVKN